MLIAADAHTNAAGGVEDSGMFLNLLTAVIVLWGATAIPAGKTTHYVAVSPNQQLLLIVNRGENTVTAANAADFRPLEVIPVGAHPNMAVFTTDGKQAYVTNSEDGSLSVLDVRGFRVDETITGLGRDVSSMAVSPDGRKLIVVVTGEDKYLIIETTTHRILVSGPTGRDPRSLALTADGRRVLIANRASNSLTEVDLATGQVVATLGEVGDKPSAVAVSPDGQRAFAALIGARVPTDPPERPSGKDAAVAVIDLGTRRKIATIGLGGDPYAVAVRE